MKQKIAYITDLHLDEQFSKDYGVNPQKNWEKILKDISNRKINKIVFGGDIGEPTSNQWFFETLTDYDLDISLGNHDQFSEVSTYFTNWPNLGKTELYYSKEEGLYKFIFLDSSSGKVSEQQVDWLKQELLTDLQIILFIHHPILPIDAVADRQFALKERDELQQVLINTGSKVSVFCGHYHLEDEQTTGNITQYITAASSVQVDKHAGKLTFSGETFGYRIIELNDGQIESCTIWFS